jgi:signal transduction histidine kinase
LRIGSSTPITDLVASSTDSFGHDQNPLRREGLLRRTAPFLAIALLAFAAVPISSQPLNEPPVIAAAVLLAAIAAAVFFVPWHRLPPYATAVPPITYFLVVALLVQSAGGGPSGYVPLALLPIFWLALYGTRSELAIAMVAAFSMFVAPLVFIHDRAYSEADLRAALLWMAISLVVGFTAQGLVRKVREGAAETERRGRELVVAQREADRLKDEFFALVSHELRTPLTSIIGYLELLREDAEGKLDGEATGHLDVIERNAHRLLRLVGDILLVAQVQAGTFTVHTSESDVCTIVSQSVASAAPAAEAKGIELNLHSGAVPRIEVDRDRLAQLLDNLISNALKFTPAGERIDVRCSASGGEIVLEVENTGSYLSPEEQQNLFDRFFRTSDAVAQAIGGVGLGLAICKAIAEAHGGEIAVQSEKGVATTFVVRLPVPDSGRTESDDYERQEALV